MFKHELGRKLLMGCGYKKIERADSQQESLRLEGSHAILPALWRCPSWRSWTPHTPPQTPPLTLTGRWCFWQPDLKAADEKSFFWPVSSINEKKEWNSPKFFQNACPVQTDSSGFLASVIPRSQQSLAQTSLTPSPAVLVCRSRFVFF